MAGTALVNASGVIHVIKQLDATHRELFRKIASLVMPQWDGHTDGICSICMRCARLQHTDAAPHIKLCVDCMRAVYAATSGNSDVDRSRNQSICKDIIETQSKIITESNNASDFLAYVVTCTDIVCDPPHIYQGVGGCDTCMRYDSLAYYRDTRVYFHACRYCHRNISERVAMIYTKLPLMRAAVSTIPQADVALYAWQFICEWMVAITRF